MRAATCTALLSACLVLSAFGGSSGATHPLIVWSQSPGGAPDERGSIGSAHVDGSHSTGRMVVGARAPAGVAVLGSNVYWANYRTGTISRVRIDGSHIDGHFIATSVYSTIGVAVDDKHIYWTSSGVDPNVGWIGRANLDGSAVDGQFIKAGDSPVGVAVAGNHIYWAHREMHETRHGWSMTYAIGRANVDGTAVEPDFVRIPTAIDGVAANDRYVFWSNEGEHVIGRATLDGDDVYQRCIDVQLKPLENVPEGLAADRRFVYWTNYPANTISRANLDGSDVDADFIRVHGVPEGVAVGETGAGSQPAPDCQAIAPALLLGPPAMEQGPYGEGWGEAAPAVISRGGASASGTISSIHWSRWGGRLAIGRGLKPTFSPHGGYYPRPVVIELRASGVRLCAPHGRLVYTRLTVREQVRPGGPFGKWFAWAGNMCAGVFG